MQRAKKKIVDLPIPAVDEVASYTEEVALRSGKFQLPLGYVRRPARGPITEDDDYVEYDLEYEDEQWLRNNTRIGERADPLSRLPPTIFERILDTLEKVNGERAQGTASVISAADAEQIVSSVLQSLSPPAPLPDGLTIGGPGFTRAMAEIYGYWTAKRTKLRKPLLRRFWPPTSSSDTNPHHTFRPHERTTYRPRRTRRNDNEVYRKMLNLKLDMRAGLELLRTVKEREAMKHEALKVQDDHFDQVLFELMDCTGAKRTPPTLVAHRERKKKESTMLKLKLKVNKPMEVASGEALDDDDGVPKAQRIGQQPRKDKVAVPAQKQRLKPQAPVGLAQEDKDKRVAVPQKKGQADAAAHQPPAAVAELQQPPYPPHAAYPGFKLGAWHPPTSLGVTGLNPGSENAVFEPEDVLNLHQMQSVRLGMLPTPAESASKRGSLPSGNFVFPMDDNYRYPQDSDAVYGDISMQRRLLNLRSSGSRSSGSVAWEQGSGVGLVNGIGCAMSTDAAAWEHVGSKPEAEHLLSSFSGRKRPRDHQRFGPRDFVLRARIGRQGRLLFDRIAKSHLPDQASLQSSVADLHLSARAGARTAALDSAARALTGSSRAKYEVDDAFPHALGVPAIVAALRLRRRTAYTLPRGEEIPVPTESSSVANRSELSSLLGDDTASLTARGPILAFIADPTASALLGKASAKRPQPPVVPAANIADARIVEVFNEQDSDAEDVYDDVARVSESSLLSSTLDTLLRDTPLS